MLATMSPTDTQYLQVPKMMLNRKARSRSKSRPRDADAPRDLPSPTEVIVSPIKLSFRHQSPPSTPLQSEPKDILPPAKTSNVTPKPIIEVPEVDSHESDPPSPPSTGSSASLASEDLENDFSGSKLSATPPLNVPLRERLIGAWKLESYIAYPTPSSTIQRPTFPMTRNVTGFIMYTPDGYMASQMLIPGQKSFKRGEGEEPQWAEAGKRSFAYCGPYYITDEGLGREETLRHTFQCCSLPGWVGDIQVRTHRFEEDGEVLVLGSESPTEIKGDKRNPVLRWRRARDNTFGVPPPPMPQIKISGPGEPS